jgi:hypothetical protein
LTASSAVENRPARRDDDQVGAAHREADHHGGRAFQVDDHELGADGRRFDRADDRFLGDASDDIEAGRRPRSRLAHFEIGRFGSASMMVTVALRLASSVASTTADVDLPAPPLGLAKTMVAMDEPQS